MINVSNIITWPHHAACLIRWVKSDYHLNMLFCILTMQIFWQYDLQTCVFTRFVYHNGNRSHWVHCIVGYSMSTVLCFTFICMYKLWIHILCTVYSKYSILVWYFIAETSSGNNYSTFPKKNNRAKLLKISLKTNYKNDWNVIYRTTQSMYANENVPGLHPAVKNWRITA